MQEENKIPLGYAPVSLPSNGKLGIPNVIHVRDFTAADILEMTSVPDTHRMQMILRVLQNGMIYEKIDTDELHEKDLEVILATVKSNWYDPFLRDVPFLKNPEGDPDDPENIGYIDIAIRDIRVKTLPDEFEEPIIISSNFGEVGFKLPRISYFTKAQKLAEQAEKKMFSRLGELNLKNKAKSNTMTPSELSELDSLERETAKTTQKFYQALLLEVWNGTVLETTEEKLHALEHIGANVWIRFGSVVEKYCTFGFDPDVTFPNPENPEEIITRRLRFQPVDFVPSMVLPDDAGYTVRFGK